VIGPHNYNVFSFALAASNPNVVYTVASDGFAYRSSNGGDTWTAPGGMFTAFPNVNDNLYVSSLAVDPQNENTVWALIGTGNLYRSTDGGASFSIVLSDPADQPTVLSLSPSGQNIIATAGRNPIVSYDGGVSWNRVNASSRVVLAGHNTFLLGTSVLTQSFLTKWSADRSHMIFSTFLGFQPSTYSGPAPGLVAGIWQINITFASNSQPGESQIYLGSTYYDWQRDSANDCAGLDRPALAEQPFPQRARHRLGA
jgi:hypothetical protein